MKASATLPTPVEWVEEQGYWFVVDADSFGVTTRRSGVNWVAVSNRGLMLLCYGSGAPHSRTANLKRTLGRAL